MFEQPSGHGNWKDGQADVPVRLTFDTSTNTLAFALTSLSQRARVSLADTITLTEVELQTEGNRWFAAEIADLQVLGITGGTVRVSDSVVGTLTAQDGPATVVRLGKNGSQTFRLHHPVPTSREFSGGTELVRDVRIASGASIRSRNGRIAIDGDLSDREDPLALRLALSLAFGHLCRTRYVASGTALTLHFGQDLHKGSASDLVFNPASEGYVDHLKVTDGVAQIVDRVLSALVGSQNGSRDRLEYLIEWFLAARSVNGLLDFRVLCLYSFLEIIDGSDTLNGQSLARLLDISLPAAKALVRVRNEVSHGRLTLQRALQAQPELNSAFFGDLTVVEHDNRPAATLMNFLMFVCNRLMLRQFGCTLPAARWVPN